MSESSQQGPDAPPVQEEELHAFVDGQLPLERRQAVEDYLAAHPEKAREVADWRRQNAAILELFGALVDAAPPARTASLQLRKIKSAIFAPRRAMAAGLMLFCLGGAVGWFANAAMAPRNNVTEAFVQNALMAHSIYAVDANHPVEIAAREESQLLRWLSDRLKRKIIAPDLTASGFALVGGRLLPGAARMAAQFMYEDQTGRRITLYTMRGKAGQLAAFRFKTEGAYQTFYWRDEELSYALIGDIERSRLKNLAVHVHRQLG